MTITVDTGNISIKAPAVNATSPQSWNHTCGANVKMLVVVITIYDTSPTDGVVSNVTYNGLDFETDKTQYYDSLCSGHVSIWHMPLPPTGSSYAIEVTFGGTVTDFAAAGIGVNGTVGSFAIDAMGIPQTGTTGDLVVSWDAVASASISFAAGLDDQTDAAKVTPQETEIYTTDVGDVVSTEYAIRSGSGSQTMTIADADGDEDWVIVGRGFYEIAGATEYQQSADGILTPVGSIVKSSGKILAGITTLTGSISKATSKTFTGSSTLAGVLVKQAQKIFTGASIFAGSLAASKQKLISLTGSLAPSGTIVKQAGKAFTGSITATGSLIRSTVKAITGSLPQSGVLATSKVTLLAIGGAITASGILARQTIKAFVGSITTIGSLATQKAGVGGEQFYKAVGGVVTMTGSITRRFGRNVSGVLITVGVVFRQSIGLPTPARRIYSIASEIRICSIASENRIYSIPRGVRP